MRAVHFHPPPCSKGIGNRFIGRDRSIAWEERLEPCGLCELCGDAALWGKAVSRLRRGLRTRGVRALRLAYSSWRLRWDCPLRLDRVPWRGLKGCNSCRGRPQNLPPRRSSKCDLGCVMGHRSPSEGFPLASCDMPYSPLSPLPQSRKESLSVGHRWEGR